MRYCFYTLTHYFFIAFFLISFQKTSAQITGDTSVCEGETITYHLVAQPNAIYSWTVVGGVIQGSSITDSLTVFWQNPGSGTLLATVNNIFYSLNVTVYPKPNPKITPLPYPSCPPSTIQMGFGNDRKECDKVCKFSTHIYSTTLNSGSTYQWFATGNVSISGINTNTVSVVWDSTSYGTLIVIETNQWGCVDSATYCVEKVNLPVALFNHQTNVCLNATVSFNNLSSGNSLSYQWYFGDGGVSNLANPTHVYSTPGTYTVTLIAINNCYCKDTFQSTIHVNSLPGPEISCPSTLCAYDTGTYSTNVTGCNYSWFASGGTIIGGNNGQSVTVAWGAGQLGMLGLVVSNCSGVCADTTKIFIPIVPAVATINGPVKVCPQECATFSLPRFSGAKYTWSLNPNACGTIKDSTCCESVEICYGNLGYPCNDTLTVAYYDSFLHCGGNAVHIIRYRPKLSVFGLSEVCVNKTAFLVSSGGVNCNWSVSPHGPVFSPNPSSSININWLGNTGLFTFTATPINPNQVCTDSASQTVNVINTPSSPTITGDTIVCAGNTVQYCAGGAGDIHWIVTGGTPSSSMGNCVTVTWGSTPPFILRAYRKSQFPPFCESDTTVQNIQSLSALPTPAISAPASVCANGTSNIFSTTSYPSNATFNWSISPSNAGSIISGQGTSNIVIEWGNNAPSVITVTLSVTVCNQTVTNNVVLNLAPVPTVSVTQLASLCKGGSAQIQAVGGTFTSVSWSGPGLVNPNVNPATIINDGLYQVTVTSASGCTAVSQINVQYVSGPTASISTSDILTYCLGAPINVTICALGNPNYVYSWNNSATSQCITVSSPGVYNATVTDISNGCFAVSNNITVQQITCSGGGGGCVSSDSAFILHSSCNPKNFFANASGTVIGYNWYFGDGFSSTLQNPTHAYSQPGFYLVTLNVYVLSTNGLDTCTLTDTAQIEIPLLAKFDFASGCFGDSVCFSDKSAYTAGNNITAWSWNFGDAATSTSQNPCHLYLSPGIYYPTLTITNGSCTTSVTDTILIPSKPTAGFAFSSNSCVNNSILFTDNSFSGIHQWNWNFGDAGTSLNQNPSHTYTISGNYPVKLVVVDTFGCKDSITQNNTIHPPALSGSITAHPDTIVCSGTNVLLVAPPCATCTYLWNTGSTNDSVTVNSTGIYTVYVTDVNGCKFSAFIKIIVHSKPAPVIVGNHKICLGNSINLQTTNNPNWTYNWISTEPGLNGNTTYSTFSSPSSAGAYTAYVIVHDTSTGCHDTSLLHHFVVNTAPIPATITALGSTTVCKGDTIALVGNHPDPAVNLQWNTGEVSDTIYVTENGCYFVNATDSNGCVAQTNFCVTFNPLPELCEFYEGCFDTCAPYTIYAPSGGASYQWLNNGLAIPGATSQSYTTSASGSYSVIVTNSFGCLDTTGILNLTLYPCDSHCVEFVIDSVQCDSTGKYLMHYHVVNHSPDTADEVGLQVLAPHLNVAYAPNLIQNILPPNSSSPALTAIIYNGYPGDTICFQTYLYQFFHDTSAGQCCKKVCCKSDTVCVVLPPCTNDTLCCNFKYIKDSIWCVTKPNGMKEYHFNVTILGCGTLNISTNTSGTISLNNPYVLTGGTVTINGIFVPSNPNATHLCLRYMMSQGNRYCADTIICMKLPLCPPPGPPCEWAFKHEICAGSSTSFVYNNSFTGATYLWQFSGGNPSSATGVGPHVVTYNTAGTYPVQLSITNNQGTTTCIDSITVVGPPVAGIIQNGNTLYAQPAGMSYQWYFAPPTSSTLIAGANNQFFAPQFDKEYCVVVSNYLGCKDTACVDYIPLNVQDFDIAYSFRVFPNPANDLFYVAMENDAINTYEVLLYDVNGILLQHIFSKEKVASVNVSEFPKGIYLLDVKVKNTSKRLRVVKL